MNRGDGEETPRRLGRSGFSDPRQVTYLLGRQNERFLLREEAVGDLGRESERGEALAFLLAVASHRAHDQVSAPRLLEPDRRLRGAENLRREGDEAIEHRIEILRGRELAT